MFNNDIDKSRYYIVFNNKYYSLDKFEKLIDEQSVLFKSGSHIMLLKENRMGKFGQYSAFNYLLTRKLEQNDSLKELLKEMKVLVMKDKLGKE